MGLNGAILAAGRGTRLHPLTTKLPKPLVPLAGRPLIEYCLDHLRDLGIETIGINAHHLADRLRSGLSQRPRDIYVVHESELQGTGGGIRGIAAQRAAETIVVINGDALFDFDLRSVIAKHRRRNALGTLVLRYVEPAAPFGRVGIDGSGRLHRVAEISAPGADSLTLFYGAYTGVQIIEPALIDQIPLGECDVLRTAYKAEISNHGAVYGDFVPPESTWIDVGTTERYLSAHWAILDGEFEVSHLPCADSSGRRISEAAELAHDCHIIGPCVIMPGAHIETGSTIGPYAFIGKNTRIRAGLKVEGSVVWEGLTVTESAKGQVVID